MGNKLSVELSALNHEGLVLDTAVISDVDVEFHFVKNALNYIKNNKSKNNTFLELYEEYLIKLAIFSYEFDSAHNVVTNLHRWIKQNLNYSKIERRIMLKVNHLESEEKFISYIF